ncbi:hypothetical protein ABW19_dt0201025 [Dactylella cylindrospora]|nr:hypothetical protein ABW19_dt0201025 [Dactylella cylindrospora]
MPPIFTQLIRRAFDPVLPSNEFSEQWQNPGDVFSVLLILGGDVVGRAIAQLAGSRVTPIAFSFGWVAYGVMAMVAIVGENRLMPFPDCSCKIINGRSGYDRDNASWIIGRIVRDFDNWMDGGKPDGPIRRHLNAMIVDKWDYDKQQKEEKSPGSGSEVPKPARAGLCVSIYKAGKAEPGNPGYDRAYYLGFITTAVQLGIAAIPCGLYGHWGIMLVTVCGIILAFFTGSLPQWSMEKWACRKDVSKTVILTKGNGSQHAIVVVSEEEGLDLEALAAPTVAIYNVPPYTTRFVLAVLAFLWILLLITASGIKSHTWYLLAIGTVGIFQNTYAAGCVRPPEAFGIPLKFEQVIGKVKVMDTLFEVEEQYPYVGSSMRDTFFPGKLRPNEVAKWNDFEETAKARQKAKEAEAQAKG